MTKVRKANWTLFVTMMKDQIRTGKTNLKLAKTISHIGNDTKENGMTLRNLKKLNWDAPDEELISLCQNLAYGGKEQQQEQQNEQGIVSIFDPEIIAANAIYNIQDTEAELQIQKLAAATFRDVYLYDDLTQEEQEIFDKFGRDLLEIVNKCFIKMLDEYKNKMIEISQL